VAINVGSTLFSDGSVQDQSVVDYRYEAYDVTYCSRGFTRLYLQQEGSYVYYSHDQTITSTTGTPLPFGPSVDLSFEVNDGASILSATTSVPLSDVSYSYDDPYHCFPFSWESLSGNVCIESHSRVSARAGTASSE